MFIPLRDANPSRRFPKVTLALILVNIGVFALQFFTDNLLIGLFGCFPVKIIELLNLNLSRIIYLPGLVSYMFLHANLLHLLGNLLFLWIFGDNIEDYLGHARFLKFYLLSGILAGLSHIFMNPGSPIPMVGASGAIAGVLGAYFLLYPKAKVTTLIFFWLTRLPANVFLGVWLTLQIIYSVISIGKPGVAWYAHIGGFAAGLVLIKIYKKGK